MLKASLLNTIDSMIETVAAAFGVLKGGIELGKSFGDEKIDLSLKVKQLLLTDQASTPGGAALAFIVLTNRSDKPQSVTDIILDFGYARAFRVPLLELESPDAGRELLDARSFTHYAMFEQENGSLCDFRQLPEDIYLQSNQSRSGCVLFMIPEVSEVKEALLILEIGSTKVLSVDLNHTS